MFTVLSVGLTLAVAVHMAWMDLLVNHPQVETTNVRLVKRVTLWEGAVKGTVVFGFAVFLFVILSGASPVHNIPQTILSSIHVAALAFGPFYVYPDFFSSHSLHLMLYGGSPATPCNHEETSRITLFATLIIMIPFMVLLILDWGSQYQRWPIPLLLGSSTGHALGNLIELALYSWNTSLGKQKKYLTSKAL
jgi:hypothetical protein